MKKPYALEDYIDAQRRAPFSEWVGKLRDTRAKVKIGQRLERVELGNFGDWKAIQGTDGICELRIPHGPGYRVYYRVVKETVVLLLIGSTKADQRAQIAKASSFFEDYKRRSSDV